MPIFKVRDDLCLDFANTLSWRGTETPAEELHDLGGLLRWIERVAVTSKDEKTEFAASFGWLGGDEAREVFAEAIALREAIFRIFSAFSTRTDVAPADLVRLEHALAAAPMRDVLARLDGAYGWRVAGPLETMAQLLAPVIWSAGDLMVTAGDRRIRRCANHECLWLFVDKSKGGTRRWCQMSACGNRAKARRHYSKIKGR
jgi:predicted RNA-binding Zn ribbon-like protein